MDKSSILSKWQSYYIQYILDKSNKKWNYNHLSENPSIIPFLSGLD